jgi:hypothetical protein
MKPLILVGTDDTPKIHFDNKTGTFEISGRSLPEEVYLFYAPVIEWIKVYSLVPNEVTVVKLKLEYFNSASQRFLLEVLTCFEKITEHGKEIKIEWHYHEGDEEMKEVGDDYEDLLNIPFTFQTYNPL